MYYSNARKKESEQFPKIMTKEDTKELSSIINSLNSSSSQNEKIGLNLQYRQVKIPKSIFDSLKQRKKNAQHFLETEKKDENNNNILSQYEENKSKEEQYIRWKMFEIENLEKKIKKLNSEENALLQEQQKIKYNLYNITNTINAAQNEIIKINNYISTNKKEEKEINEKIKEIETENGNMIQKIKAMENLEMHIKEKKNIKNEEINIKKMLCCKCKDQPSIYFYSVCKHLALCKKCYAKKNNNAYCPICSQKNELVIKVYIDKSNNDFISNYN